MVREPEAVINSLCRLLQTRHHPVQKRKYLLTYVYYNQRILHFLTNNPEQNVAVISFEELIKFPDNKLKLIGEKFNFSFDDKLFSGMFDKKVISTDQSISYVFLKNLLKQSKAIHERLKPYFI
jgi:hypothetical protein